MGDISRHGLIGSRPTSRRFGLRRSRHLLQLGDALTLVLATTVATAASSFDALTFLVLGLGGITARHILSERPFRAKRLTSRTLLAPLLAACITLLILAAAREPYSGFHLLTFIVIWTLGMVLVRRLVWRFTPPARVLLVGDSEVFDDFMRSPDVDVHRRQRPPSSVLGWDFIALDGVSPVDRDWASWLAHADMVGVNVVNAHTLSEEISGKVALRALVDRWAAEVFQGDSQYQPLKRVLDLAAAIALSPLLVPMAAFVALLVRLDGAGPVLFLQDRVGLRGKVFKMVKFRTMHHDAEAKGSAFASQGDARVTRVGQVLRKFRLDELPQFWNVLKGEMSIIGPRPEQLTFVQEFEEKIPLFHLRHNVRPGITGWAQVRQGYAADLDTSTEKLRHDFWYIKNFSFWTDLRVACLTFLTILTGFGSR